jgi:hypothetical protein
MKHGDANNFQIFPAERVVQTLFRKPFEKMYRY